MNTRSLLTIALGLALAAPAYAQSGSTASDTLGTAQDASTATQATEPEEEATRGVRPTLRDRDDTARQDDAAETALQNENARSDRGAAEAATHSMASMRGTWAALDANGDGRISRDEAAANADFQSSFEMMDADGDGFVSDAEYRTHAKAGDGKDK